MAAQTLCTHFSLDMQTVACPSPQAQVLDSRRASQDETLLLLATGHRLDAAWRDNYVVRGVWAKRFKALAGEQHRGTLDATPLGLAMGRGN